MLSLKTAQLFLIVTKKSGYEMKQGVDVKSRFYTTFWVPVELITMLFRPSTPRMHTEYSHK